MIVVVILGLIATGTAIAVFPSLIRGQEETTRMNAGVMRNAAQLWVTQHSDRCPQPRDLVDAQLLDRGSTLSDAWDTSFKIACDGDDVTVLSFGRDKHEGTADDIFVPKPDGKT